MVAILWNYTSGSQVTQTASRVQWKFFCHFNNLSGSKAVTGKDFWQSLHRTLSSLTLGLTSNTDCISAAVENLPPAQQFIRVKSSDWQRPLATLTQDLVILILGFTSNTDCISSAIEILSATSRIYQGQQQWLTKTCDKAYTGSCHHK